jgi:hypothetical protein
MLATPGWASWRERRGGLGLDALRRLRQIFLARITRTVWERLFRPHSGDVLLSNQILLIHAEAAEPTV